VSGSMVSHMEAFRRISIKGLLGNGDFEISFSNENVNLGPENITGESLEGSAGDPVRLVYGVNGGGKTSVLRIIKALLEGDFPTLLSMPFESVEIERWEPWGFDSENYWSVPGGVEGAYLDCVEKDVTGNFDDMYNYMKFVTKDFGAEGGWDLIYPTRISGKNANKIEKWLDENPDVLESVKRISEHGAFEFGMSNAHSHIFRLKKFVNSDLDSGLEVEYVQNRNPRGWSELEESLLKIMGFDRRSIVGLVGKELLSKGGLNFKRGKSLMDFTAQLQILNGEESLDFPIRGSPMDLMEKMDVSHISKMAEPNGVLDLSDVVKTWKAFNGDREYWGPDCCMKWFDDEIANNHGQYPTKNWTDDGVIDRSKVTLIGPDITHSKKDMIKEIVRMQEQRLAWVHTLDMRGWHPDRIPRFDLASFLTMDEQTISAKIDELWQMKDPEKIHERLEMLAFLARIATFLHLGKASRFSHWWPIGERVDDIIEKSHLKRIVETSFHSHRKEWKGLYQSKFGERSFDVVFPFFYTYIGMIRNKRLLIDDDLKTVFVDESRSVIPIGKLSHGELRLTYLFNVISGSPLLGKRWATVLIDEPEVGLHIQWQRALIPQLKDELIRNNFVERPPVKIVIATHSPEIVASSPGDAIPVTSMSDNLGVNP